MGQTRNARAQSISLQRQHGIEAGTKAAVEATPEGILIKPITRAYIHSLRGSLKGKGVLKALIEDCKRERLGVKTEIS